MKENVLYYFKQPTVSVAITVFIVETFSLQDNELIGSIPLDLLSVRPVDDPKTPVSAVIIP